MITPSEQRFRHLFHALDAENEWKAFLSDSQLQYARRAAATQATWLRFFAGMPFMKDGDAEMGEDRSFTDDDIWTISSIIRKRVTFAAIDEDFFTKPVDDREDDHGLMSGDDGGYADYDQLKHEEDLLRNEKTGVYKLFGYQGDDMAKMPKPLFGGRVREVLMKIKKVCDADAMKAIMQVIDVEARDEYDTVEDCLTAVEKFISGYGMSLGETCAVVEKLVKDFREEYERFTEWFKVNCAEKVALGGVLGLDMKRISGEEGSWKRVACDEECVRFKGAGGAAHVSVAKRPRALTFRNFGWKINDRKSLWELLGPTNAVVKNLGLYERVIKLKQEMCRLQDLKDGKNVKDEDVEMEVGKCDDEIIEIGEELDLGQTNRPRAMGESVVALLLSHTGFTDGDTRALEMLTDVFEDYVGDIGRSLISCRENIDNNAATVAELLGRVRRKSREELLMELEMIMDCVKGGFAELYNYVRADMMRTEQALREVEMRLKQRVKGLGGSIEQVVEEEIDGSDVVDENDIVVDGEGLPFGYLGKRVWLDCLDGLKVPTSLVFP